MYPGDYEAIVYDLDGTLVDLDVDWDAVRREVGEKLRERDVTIDGEHDLWEMSTLAEDADLAPVFEGVVSEHEREGARNAVGLPAIEAFPRDVPVGVCSLNCEGSCRLALEQFDVDGHVDVIVGRDSHEARKPDPGPLLAAIDALGADPARSLFVGDSASDATAAERAGVDFQWISEHRRDE